MRPDESPEQKPPEDEHQKKLIEYRQKRSDLKATIPALWQSATDDKGKLDMAALIKLVVLKIMKFRVLEDWSGKPSKFYDLVESCSPGPYLEMFSRSARRDWVSWGESSAAA